MWGGVTQKLTQKWRTVDLCGQFGSILGAMIPWARGTVWLSRAVAVVLPGCVISVRSLGPDVPLFECDEFDVDEQII